MKTRNHTKKEKFDYENRKIPQLNEDVLGIILKHVVRKEKVKIFDSMLTIRNHFMFDLKPGLGSELFDLFFDRIDTRWDTVEWPDYLDSNSRRLIHHTNVKLFPYVLLSIHKGFNLHLTTKRELDSFWKTLKYFGGVRVRSENPGAFELYGMAYYFRNLWTLIQARLAARNRLIEKLEKS